jgi:phosphatidyl-myo-inositol dimannoside synthase
MMPNSRRSIHVWVPNVFEFKGGIQVYLQDLLTVLATEFADLDFLVIDKLDRQAPTDKLYANNFSFALSGKIPKFWQTPYYSLNLILQAYLKPPSLIVCGLVNFSPVALLLHRLFGIPYWIVAYGIDVWDVTDPLKIQALHGADRIISIGQYTRNRLIQEQNLSIDRIPLLPVTFDASRFAIGQKPDYLLSRYGLQTDRPIILTVARLAGEDRYKGYDRILAALPQIRAQIPDVHYLLVGKGDDRPRIERAIADLQLQDCVTLAGFIPDAELCDHYNLCDVFAMPSKGEGFGIVYLEALACGKPTLGGDRDGAIDALCQGELGVLVNPDDVEAIAQALTQMLQKTYPHPLLYQPESLRERAIATFGFEKFEQTLVQLLAMQGFPATPHR